MKLRRYVVALLIAAGAGAVAFALTTWQFFEGSVGQLELATIDYRMQSLPRHNPDSTAVRLVLFDSAFVKSWPYLSPFPRAALASLIDAASQAGAKTIGLDVFLGDRYPVLNAMDSSDVKLHDAMKRAGNVVLVAPTSGSETQREVQLPDTYFTHVAAAVGTADLPTPFETVRDGVLTVRTSSGMVPSFALAMYGQFKGENIDSLARAYASTNGDATRTFPILYEGPPSRTDRDDGAFRAMSGFALQQLAQNSPAALSFAGLQGKVVILGSGFHESERFRTPFYSATDSTGTIDGWTYGPEIHANALQNLLSNHFLRSFAWYWKFLLAFALALAVAIVTFARGTKWGAFAFFALAVATSVVAWIVFSKDTLVMPIIGPSLAGLFALLGSTSYVSVVEGKEKRMIKGAFGKFVSPAVVDELVADPSKLKLGGEKRLISVLFSDLAGFTSMSERLDPERLVHVLNEYLDEMSDIVIADGGTLDKYIGDAIMALYGAPTSMSDHATACCRTALDMQRKLNELNARWQAADATWPTLKCRIGINSGTPVVGNIGGEKRFDYTALGDAVNLAARLEPACKTYGVAIMIAQVTREFAGDAIQVRELDMLAVYGKKEPVRVYELLALQCEDLGVKK